MTFTVTSNVERANVFEETKQTIEKLSISKEKNYLFFICTGSLNSYLGSLHQYLSANNQFDSVILVFPYESPDYYKCISHLSQLVQTIFRLKFAFLDYGADIGYHNHFTFNNFINENHSSWYPSSSDSRHYKWVCANRVLKPHRINLIEKLLQIQQNDNLITAGNFRINQTFLNLINFPIPISAPDELVHNENDFESTRFIPNSFRNSVFNIVTESSYENIGDVFETWSRIMITEKTTKAYRLYQFPIFLAPAGHVNLQRQLGFDVFDDLIDHSYDNCKDPFRRIEMIINLCNDINHRPLRFWQSKIEENWSRLQQNNFNCDLARSIVENKSIIKFQHWNNS